MKILLIRYHDSGNINTRLPASLNKAQGVLPALGIAYIASVLEEAGYKVSILDALALNLTTQEVKEEILKQRPDIVGVTAMTSNIRGAFEALKLAKQAGAITVIGGVHLSIYAQETLSYDFIDYGINGEGEYPFLALVKAIEARAPVDAIPGLIYKTAGKVVVNDAYIHENIDEIPFPSRHLLPMDRYSSIIGLHPVTTMISSRGCPYQCGFCFKAPADARHRVRSAKNVVDEMELLVNKYKIREIMFYDDTLTLRRDHIVEICEEVLRRGLKVKWESPTRVDRIDEPLLRLMRSAGCIRLRYGVESGDPDILKLMKKEIDLELVEKVFQMTKRCGIETFAYFIIGYLHDTPESMQRTIDFACRLNPDMIMFTIATPYPNTPLFEQAANEGRVNRDYWRDFTLESNVGRMSYLVPDAELWLSRAYRDFYFRPGYLFSRLFKMHSWDSVKKHFYAARGILLFDVKGDA